MRNLFDARRTTTECPGLASLPVPAPVPTPDPAPGAAHAGRTASGFSYHRMGLDTPRPRWWRPLITVAVTVGCCAAMFVAAVLVVALFMLASGTDDLPGVFLPNGEPDMNTPLGALLGFGTVALLLPALAVGVRVGERRCLGTMSSVAGRLRWRLLAPGLVLAAILLTIALLIDLARVAGDGPVRPVLTASTWAMVAIALLVVPFQAAAEEYVFRALPMQVLGTWLKHPLWGVLLPIPVFVLGHGYDPLGQVDVGVFALVAGILVWRTGGLELAIALHVVNNSVATLLTAVGLSDANATTIDPSSFLASLGVMIGFTVLALRFHRQQQIKGVLA